MKDKRIEFVYKNVGKVEFAFEEVSEQEYLEFLRNYPNLLEYEPFMDWNEWYDLEKYKDGDNIQKFKVARYYGLYGDTYFLPKV